MKVELNAHRFLTIVNSDSRSIDFSFSEVEADVVAGEQLEITTCASSSFKKCSATSTVASVVKDRRRVGLTREGYYRIEVAGSFEARPSIAMNRAGIDKFDNVQQHLTSYESKVKDSQKWLGASLSCLSREEAAVSQFSKTMAVSPLLPFTAAKETSQTFWLPILKADIMLYSPAGSWMAKAISVLVAAENMNVPDADPNPAVVSDADSNRNAISKFTKTDQSISPSAKAFAIYKLVMSGENGPVEDACSGATSLHALQEVLELAGVNPESPTVSRELAVAAYSHAEYILFGKVGFSTRNYGGRWVVEAGSGGKRLFAPPAGDFAMSRGQSDGDIKNYIAARHGLPHKAAASLAKALDSSYGDLSFTGAVVYNG